MVTAAHRRIAITILLFATFMDLLDVTIVQVALPSIGVDLQASGTTSGGVVSGYLLAFAVALVTGGSLGDIFGRKRICPFGAGGVTRGSGLCSGAPTVGVHVAARRVEGRFAGARVPTPLAGLR